jgi:hypothetical protein
MPLIWLRDFTTANGKTAGVLCSTIGSGPDFQSEDLRRLLVNACYRMVGLEVPDRSDVRYVGDYEPTFFGFGEFKRGRRPGELGGTGSSQGEETDRSTKR